MQCVFQSFHRRTKAQAGSCEYVYFILSVCVMWSLPPAPPCLEADFTLLSLSPYCMKEGEVDLAWWTRGVVQPAGRDAAADLLKMLHPDAKQKPGDS